jgi:hypothetical protein
MMVESEEEREHRRRRCSSMGELTATDTRNPFPNRASEDGGRATGQLGIWVFECLVETNEH